MKTLEETLDEIHKGKKKKTRLEDLTEVLELLESLDQLQPLVGVLCRGLERLMPALVKDAEPVLRTLAAELQPLFNDIGVTIRKKNVEAFRFYEKEGFTREEALILLLGDRDLRNDMLGRAYKRTKG